MSSPYSISPNNTYTIDVETIRTAHIEFSTLRHNIYPVQCFYLFLMCLSCTFVAALFTLRRIEKKDTDLRYFFLYLHIELSENCELADLSSSENSDNFTLNALLFAYPTPLSV